MPAPPPFTLDVRDLGALSGSQPVSFSLDRDRPDVGPEVKLGRLSVENNSQTVTVTLGNLPGRPIVQPGERNEFHVGGRSVQFTADGSVSADEVTATFEFEEAA